MARQALKQVWTAIQNLSPDEVRAIAERHVLIGLHARSDEAFEEMEEFLVPPTLSREKRILAFDHVVRAEASSMQCDIAIYEHGLRHPSGTFSFHPADAGAMVREVLAARDDLSLALARLFPAFREVVVDRTIHTIAKENAWFSLATALPDMVPSLIELPWAIGQFASDTAFLTANQIRMAFLLAAASDRPLGYAEQKAEIGSIVAGAFGWRAVSRQLVGKIPFGGGLIPKAAIAYAGTYVAGRVLEKLYRQGHAFTRQERRAAYESAFDQGKRVAAELLDRVKAKPGHEQVQRG